MMIFVGCSHRPTTIKIPPPDFVNGFFQLEVYDQDGSYVQDVACLDETDFRELYTFLLNAAEYCVE